MAVAGEVSATSSMMLLANADPDMFLHNLFGTNHHFSAYPAGPHLLERLRRNGGGHGFG